MRNLIHYRWLFIILLISCGVWLQVNTFIHGDITWLVHVSERWLRGGSYYYDFIEVNPPAAIYIYAPAVLINHIFYLGFINSIIVYLFALSLSSWLFCYYLLAILTKHTTKILAYWLEISIALIYFVNPAFTFGEREYLLIVLILPYLLVATIRLQAIAIGLTISLGIGLLAGIGFILKPYFLPIWLGIELYLIIRTKKLSVLSRPEIIACCSIVSVYLFSILLITPDYIGKIIPLITPIYYLLYTYPLKILIFQQVIYFAVFLLFIYCLLRKNAINQILMDLLAITLMGTLFIYFSQGTLWNYHLAPIYMIGTLLLSVLISEFITAYDFFMLTKLNSHFFKAIGLVLYLFFLSMFPLAEAVCSIQASLNTSKRLFNSTFFKLVKTVGGQPIYIFTEDMLINYPSMDYSNTFSPSKLPSLWPIVAAQLLANSSTDPAKKMLAQKIAAFVRTTEINSLVKTKPVYFFIPQYKIKLLPSKTRFLTYEFIEQKTSASNIFNYFLLDPRFQQLWRHYRYVGLVDGYAVYQLMIG